jgi:hypothetical protein
VKRGQQHARRRAQRAHQQRYQEALLETPLCFIASRPTDSHVKLSQHGIQEREKASVAVS